MFIEKMFNSLNSLKGDTKYRVSFSVIMKEIQEFLNIHASDRRYKVKILASTTSYRSMLLMYKGVKYYVSHNYKEDKYEVEVA